MKRTAKTPPVTMYRFGFREDVSGLLSGRDSTAYAESAEKLAMQRARSCDSSASIANPRTSTVQVFGGSRVETTWQIRAYSRVIGSVSVWEIRATS
jgi:hypothetical protein